MGPQLRNSDNDELLFVSDLPYLLRNPSECCNTRWLMELAADQIEELRCALRESQQAIIHQQTQMRLLQTRGEAVFG